jgi:formylglycine-generating enzyme required for sulfatase activity
LLVILQRRLIQRWAFAVALVSMVVARSPAHAVTIDWVTVGDAGNTADNTGYGVVADAFRMMKFEFTNQQYTDFLNSVAATDTYSLYDTSMGTNPRSGITQSGPGPGSWSYSVRSNMGDKPVNYVNWFDAARVANWLHNGATSSSSTETGAYTLVNGQTSGMAPARNANAKFYIPTEDQWYKAAYYKGGNTNAGYWDYATQSDTAPAPVTSGSTGIGSAGGVGNFANYKDAADWNGQNGNVTTVATNGGPSAYDLYDMGGNVQEWNDLTGNANSSRGLRGGKWTSFFPTDMSSSDSITYDASFANDTIGFRLAAVPEPSTWVMGLAGIACAGWGAWRRRKRA